MSDSNPVQPTDPGVEGRGAQRRRGDQRRVDRALWQGVVALLLAIAALIAALYGGWRFLELQRAFDAERGSGEFARDDRRLLQEALAKMQSEQLAVDAASARLEPLPARLEALDGRLGRLEARLEAPERAVATAEAAHLVELASHRLALEHDVRGAIELFEAADARLASRSDPAALRIRAQLAHDLAALRATAAPDVRALGARLAAAEAAARDLPMLGAIQNQYLPPGSPAPAASGPARAWRNFTTSLQDLISVRRVSDATVRLVSLEEIGVRRHHLQTLLFATRLAALRADQGDYATNLADARDWLARFFDPKDARTRAVDADLAALSGSRVSPDLPDVSGSLRLLRAAAP